MNKSFKVLPLTSHLSIDESTIRYYGKQGTKQFVWGKPIRFGFKLFSLASPSGYLYHAEPYCGSNSALSHISLGLGANVVLSLAESCQVAERSKLYFDHWFTSLQLHDKLKLTELVKPELFEPTEGAMVRFKKKKELQK